MELHFTNLTSHLLKELLFLGEVARETILLSEI